MAAQKDKIYDAKALAKFFGVTEKTIWEWCREGRLPAFKIGKEWRVRASDLEKTIKLKTNAPKDNRAKLF